MRVQAELDETKIILVSLFSFHTPIHRLIYPPYPAAQDDRVGSRARRETQ